MEEIIHEEPKTLDDLHWKHYRFYWYLVVKKKFTSQVPISVKWPHHNGSKFTRNIVRLEILNFNFFFQFKRSNV